MRLYAIILQYISLWDCSFNDEKILLYQLGKNAHKNRIFHQVLWMGGGFSGEFFKLQNKCTQKRKWGGLVVKKTLTLEQVHTKTEFSTEFMGEGWLALVHSCYGESVHSCTRTVDLHQLSPLPWKQTEYHSSPACPPQTVPPDQHWPLSRGWPHPSYW